MSRMDPPMQLVALMQEFKWSYNDYMDTPNYIVTLALEKMKRDHKREELAAKKYGR